MAMRIANNNTAALILGELKKNNHKLSKDLKKVSSGLKTNDAGDGVADYSISEKMRALIRSLNQDIDNSKKGIDLVKVAEGGIQQIIEELRNMKKMALDSANDHNSEIDRVIIQKEFASRIKEINDIAVSTEYNRKILLDGRYWLKEYEELIPIYEREYVKIISSNAKNNSRISIDIDTNFMHIPSSLEFVSSKLGVYKNNLDRKVLFTNANTNSVENLIFDPNEVMKYNSFQGLFPLAEGRYLQKTYPVQDGPIESKEFDSYAPIPYIYFPQKSTSQDAYSAEPGSWGYLGTLNNGSFQKITSIPPKGTILYTLSDVYYYTGDTSKAYIVSEEIFTGKLILNRPGVLYGHNLQNSELLDFSKATLNGISLNYPTSLDGQGFAIMCNECNQFVSILFDANRDVGQGIIVKSQNPDTETSEAYVIGIKDVSSGRELESALFKGIANATQGWQEGTNLPKSVQVTSRHNVTLTQYLINGETRYVLKKEDIKLCLVEGFNGKITGGNTPATGSDSIPGGGRYRTGWR